MRHPLIGGALAVLCLAASLGMQAKTRSPYPPKKKIYHKGWIDLNKNGQKDVYEDPTRPTEERVADLLRQMTMEEKTCQLATYYGYKKSLPDSLPTVRWQEMVLKDGIANIDEHISNGEIAENASPRAMAEALRETQRFFVEYTRLGIPVDLTNEGIRGLAARHATSFPSMNALGCTWDKDLAYLEGCIEGREARALGYTNVYAPILDVARDQRWGRFDGTIAEDPYLVARLGVAMSKGIQEQRVVSTPKHFVGYGDCKAARQFFSRTDPHVTPSEMYYIHEYPFRKVFQEAGALGVMCALSDYNGDPMAGSYEFLTNKLRKEMGFKGYVVSDSYAIERLCNFHYVCEDLEEATLRALQAGLNVRTRFDSPDVYINHIRTLVREGRLSEERLNELVADVLRVKFWIGLFDQPYTGDPEQAQALLKCDAHQEAALRASRECLVLLKNENRTLPLSPDVKRIAVIGPNAHTCNYVPTHYGPSDFTFVSVYDGLQTLCRPRGIEVSYAKGVDVVNPGWPATELFPEPLSAEERQGIDEAVRLAEQSDVAVLVLGDGIQTSGESRTRSSLDLPGRQEDLLKAVVATGKPVVLVLVWGRPATINYADRYVPAILAAPYPGAQGGMAIAEALLGDYNPGGKLNSTWPRSVGQLPMNIPCKPGANDEQIGTPSAAVQGLLYCFGHGLSYTTFAYDSLHIDQVYTRTGDVEVSCRVTNTGQVAGDEVVQLYINDVISSTTAYEKVLRGFERVHLQPGESKTVRFRLVPDDLMLVNLQNEKVVEPGEFSVMIGSSIEDIRLTDSFFVVGEGQQTYRKKEKVVPQDTYKLMMYDPDKRKRWKKN
ncbi:MAG: glycoside hydrolase family 3 N-terminal domain-containing protein [Bacteroidaceae bacterium]